MLFLNRAVLLGAYMAATNAPEQNSITTRDTRISTIYTRVVLLGAYVESAILLTICHYKVFHLPHLISEAILTLIQFPYSECDRYQYNQTTWNKESCKWSHPKFNKNSNKRNHSHKKAKQRRASSQKTPHYSNEGNEQKWVAKHCVHWVISMFVIFFNFIICHLLSLQLRQHLRSI